MTINTGLSILDCATDSVAMATDTSEMSETITMTGKTSIAVQANDYEIERRSGILPARRRIIPFKFRCSSISTTTYALKISQFNTTQITLTYVNISLIHYKLLPIKFKPSETIDTVRKQLKTYLFEIAFPP